MAVDLKKNNPLWVSRAVEGCTEESMNNLLPDVQSGIVVRPIVPKENLSETFTKSEILEGISVIPQTTLRKKCTTCGGILHEVNSIEPLANFHNQCFQCSRCMKQLSPLNFKMVGGMPYCEPICQNVRVQKVVQDSKQKSVKPNLLQFIPTKVNVRKGPGNNMTIWHPCAVCDEECDQSEMIPRDGYFYHDRCMKCEVCDSPVGINEDTWVAGRPFCKKHHESIQKYTKPIPVKTTTNGNSVTTEKTISIRLTDRNKRYQSPVPVKRQIKEQNSLSLNNLDEIQATQNHNRNSFVSAERTMNNHTESGLTLFTRNSYTPPMKQRVVRFESRHNSMKNLSKIGSEQHCFVCGKVVYPAFKLAHKSRIYHDTCIRCEMCDRPLTVDSMHLVKGMVLCSEHSSSVVSSKVNSSAMREISLENLKIINEGDGKSLSVDGPLITTARPVSTVKVSTVPTFVKESQNNPNQLHQVISAKNGRPPTSPRQISYNIPKTGSPLNENQKEIRVRSSSPFEYAVHSQTSWKGEINRKLKTKTEIARIRTVIE